MQFWASGAGSDRCKMDPLSCAGCTPCSDVVLWLSVLRKRSGISLHSLPQNPSFY